VLSKGKTWICVLSNQTDLILETGDN